MALTAQQIAARKGKLTASAVGALMSGDRERIMNLWRELTGDPDYKPANLRDKWPIRLGETTEQLNLDWYEFKRRQEVTKRGEVIAHPTVPWAAATLDGWIAAIGCPIEAKHVGGREPFESIVARYTPQCHWQMDCTGSQECVLSVIEGSNEPRIEIIKRSFVYAEELWHRATRFMDCVSNLAPPFVERPVAPPVQALRSVDMTGRNEWADSAITWLQSWRSAREADAAEKSLKGMMPVDAGKAYGHGIEITRDRAGRLSLREAA